MNRKRTLAAAVIVAALLPAIGSAQARNLTFEDRVEAQEVIERLHYSHQIGAAKAFEEAVPRSILERKVRTYLKQSVALEKFWGTGLS